MTSRSSFRRKIVYWMVIGALVFPLFWLSQPATNAVRGVQGSPGGKLAQLRDKYLLSQAQLGQVDPTSVTVKLATLGMRGVAANILWTKATDFKMKKDWTNFGATLNQIAKVQPHFLNVWLNQSWNISYNVSVEFDDYRQRYRWVIKGFDFLQEGIRHNQKQPRLQWELGWDVSHKIGKADERKQFRKLFARDEDYRASLPADIRDGGLNHEGRLDNWLVGKKWFERVVEMVDAGLVIIGQGMLEKEQLGMRGKSPLLYRADGPMCQMNYAEALEKDGTFGEVAKAAWIGAAGEWRRYGDDDIPTSFKDEKNQQPIRIKLNEEEMREQTVKKLMAQIDAIEPGLRDKLVARKRAALSKAQRKALDTPPEKRTGKDFELAMQAEEAVKVTHGEVARSIAGPKRKEAIKLANAAAYNEDIAAFIRRYREIVNFVYWRLRAQVEQSDDMLAARRLLNEGDRSYSEARPESARDAYQQGFQRWRKVLDKYPSMVPDQTTGDDLMDSIKRYRRILGQLDERFPDPFLLQDVLDAHEEKPTSPPPKDQQGERRA